MEPEAEEDDGQRLPKCQAIAFPISPFHSATGIASKAQQEAAVRACEKPHSVLWYICWHQSSFAR